MKYFVYFIFPYCFYANTEHKHSSKWQDCPVPDHPLFLSACSSPTDGSLQHYSTWQMTDVFQIPHLQLITAVGNHCSLDHQWPADRRIPVCTAPWPAHTQGECWILFRETDWGCGVGVKVLVPNEWWSHEDMKAWEWRGSGILMFVIVKVSL